jgi:ribosomal protein S6--L-glutamate ligase
MPEVIQLLSEWGARVDTIYPEEGAHLTAASVEHDLYVLKSGSDRALSLAGALHALGAQVLNPFPASAILRDRISVAHVLEAAGIPTPATYVTGDPSDLAALLAEGPLMIKPHRGSHDQAAGQDRGSQGQGVFLVRDTDDLNRRVTRPGLLFAQRWLPCEGEDHKIYCINDQVFGVRRRWPAETYEQKLGEPLTITVELRDIARNCGQVFGVELFGVDIILSGGRPYVVDVNSFPGFKGVPDAALRLADQIYAAAREAAERLSRRGPDRWRQEAV